MGRGGLRHPEALHRLGGGPGVTDAQLGGAGGGAGDRGDGEDGRVHGVESLGDTRGQLGRRKVDAAPETEFVDGQKAVGGVGAEIGGDDRVGDDDGADGGVWLETAADSGGDDEVVRAEGERGGGGRGGGSGADPGGQHIHDGRRAGTGEPRGDGVSLRRHRGHYQYAHSPALRTGVLVRTPSRTGSARYR